MPSAPNAAPSLRHFPALDGLRFVLCTMVVLGHCFTDPALLGDAHHPLHHFFRNLGSTGVDVFFALSGFLITKILLDERSTTGKVDLLAFYIRRTLRIWPVYFASVLACYAAILIFGERFLRPFSGKMDPDLFRVALPAFLLFVSNWLSMAVPAPLQVLWSVGVEEQFYVLFPVTFVFARRKQPVFLCVAIGLAIAMICRYWIGASGHTVRHFTPAIADNLLLGALLAQLLHARPAAVVALFRRAGFIGELLAIAALVAFNQWLDTDVSSGLGWVAYYFVSGLTAALMVGAIGFGDGPVARLLASRPLRYLGQLTYAGYVFHMYAVGAAWSLVHHKLGLAGWPAFAVRCALAVPGTMLIAWLIRITFEKRILDLKDRFVRVPVEEPRIAAQEAEG